ncbi:MAG: hypothetical protein A4C66_08225 [Nitrospira sp. HN-bin3]|uniref:Trm112 family protein n=1 Tax=Nitrospira cf. moscoviensis SBR1015 TaxID=96242 RepID=UPI000A0B7F82|nr:hypothetical protein [Nitrospira cf. moscoviensis SBR1015]MBH0207229.1 hypothetical protein [Nitrospira sp.]OQW44213.1 MAG: hypothetical protein A4C66_08225 [Nitrospira sp. HN-bin3]
MNINPDLLAILCCPETKQKVAVAEDAVIVTLNSWVTRGELKNKGNRSVTEPFEAGLVREDGALLYPIRNNIPVMLIEEGIPLAQIQ